MAEVEWWKVTNQSLAVAVRNVGFDLAIFDQYTKTIQDGIKIQARKEALQMIEDDFFDISDGIDLRDIRYGIYVICVSNPFTISYKGGHSNVVYIGRGHIFGRIKSHYQRSLFSFMQSLSGASFDFHFCEPKRPGSPNFWEHVEFLLLEEFRSKAGGGELPLLNKNSATNLGLKAPAAGWKKPLNMAGQTPLWALEFRRADFRDYLLD